MNAVNLKRPTWKLLLLLLASTAPGAAFSENGVSDTEILIGGVMDLEGPARNLGLAMRAGIDAALENEKVGKRSVRFLARNDGYSPDKTVEQTHKLIEEEKVFAMAGTVGTTMAKRTLPIMAEHGVPVIGYNSGADFLREGAVDVINYRTSFSQEIKAVVEKAISLGLEPDSVCAFVRNDDYGMAAVKGLAQAFKPYDELEKAKATLQKLLIINDMQVNRNGVGPVGTYVRGALSGRAGYDSLKLWEKQQNVSCRLVVTIGTYDAIARFIAYAIQKEEPWLFTSLSFTGAEKLFATLSEFGVADRVIMTQIVPLAAEENQANLPAIAINAQAALGSKYNTVSQEGYIVGKMLLHGLRSLEEEGKEITRQNFLEVFTGQEIDLDGLLLDYSNDNQGTDMVTMTRLTAVGWSVMENDDAWRAWLAHLDHSDEQSHALDLEQSGHNADSEDEHDSAQAQSTN